MQNTVFTPHPRSVRLLVLSDLHLEFGPPSWTPQGGFDVAVLAGDIELGTTGITWAREFFGPGVPIVYVAGNHEFYNHSDWYTLIPLLRQEAARQDVHLLEKDSVEILGLRFLGCTLWSDFELMGTTTRIRAMREAERALNDYSCIRLALPALDTGHVPKRLTPEHTLERHLQGRAWLEAALMQGERSRTVVVTHHYPSMQSTAPQYRNDFVSAAFGSNLDYLVGQCALWIHGHTHTSFDYRINGTRVVCNPQGYPLRRGPPMENVHFNPHFVVEVTP